ncbi:hypothetical protein [Chryseobacterium sp.]|uniref:hypothetical protein n=1 Tax=Chryseobacterium sp. TaxID=1871047 RepID=UPI00388FA40D
MKILNYLRYFFAVNLILIIITRIIIPGYKEIKREKKISDVDIKNYIKDSEIIKLVNFKKINYSVIPVEYFDGTPFVKKVGYKRIAYLTSDDQKIYKIELYHPQSILILNNNVRKDTYLSINKNELNKKGSMEDPIVALRYSVDGFMNNNVSDEKYNYNVKEYLTYKDYKPFTSADPWYYIIMVWVFVTIAGFSTTTGILIKKGYINKEGNYEPNGPSIKSKQ